MVANPLAGWAVSVPTNQRFKDAVVRAIYAVRLPNPDDAERLVCDRVKPPGGEAMAVGILAPETLDRLNLGPGELVMM
jgi:hypothetical protein